MSIDLNIFKHYKAPKKVEEVAEVWADEPYVPLVDEHYEKLRTHAYNKLFGNLFLPCSYISIPV